MADLRTDEISSRHVGVKRKKKPKRQKTGNDDKSIIEEHVWPSSDKSCQLAKKKSKDKEKCDEKISVVTKVTNAQNDSEKQKGRHFGASCLDESVSPVEDKSTKKRKRPKHVHGQPQDRALTAETETSTGHSVKKNEKNKREKKKKVKRDAGKNQTGDASEAKAPGSALVESSQYRALEYLRSWKSARESWTFQKVRQVWLLQNMYHPDKVGVEDFFVLVEYLENLVGKARQATVEAAEKILREAEDAEETADGGSDAGAKCERIRQVLQILS